MQSLSKFLFESEDIHDYYSVQLDFPGLTTYDKVIEIIDKSDLLPLPKEDSRPTGVEEEPHITVAYGFHDDFKNEIEKLVEDYGPIEVRFGNMKMFADNPNHDCIVVEAKSKKLMQLRRALIREFPNTQTFDNYIPHLTLAYLKKGKADIYDGQKCFLTGKEATAYMLTCSGKNENKQYVYLV